MVCIYIVLYVNINTHIYTVDLCAALYLSHITHTLLALVQDLAQGLQLGLQTGIRLLTLWLVDNPLHLLVANSVRRVANMSILSPPPPPTHTHTDATVTNCYLSMLISIELNSCKPPPPPPSLHSLQTSFRNTVYFTNMITLPLWTLKLLL